MKSYRTLALAVIARAVLDAKGIYGGCGDRFTFVDIIGNPQGEKRPTNYSAQESAREFLMGQDEDPESLIWFKWAGLRPFSEKWMAELDACDVGEALKRLRVEAQQEREDA